MPKYVDNRAKEPRSPNAANISMQLGRDIAGAIGDIQESREKEIAFKQLDDPSLSPIKKAAILSKYSPQVAAQYAKHALEKEQADAMQQNDANIIAGLTGGVVEQPRARVNNISELTQRFQQPVQAQEVPMPGGLLTGKQYAPVAQMQQPEVAQQVQPMSLAEALMQKSIPQLIDLQTKFQTPEQKKMIAQIIDEKQKNEVNATKLRSAEIKALRQEEAEIRKENQPYKEKILGRVPAMKKLGGQIDRLEQLNEKVEVTPAAYKTLEYFGIPLGTFDTANAQELEKLANDLTANIQSDYGNRILATEFNTFLKRIPTLLNSKEGRERIIKNMKIYKKAQEVEYDAWKKVHDIQKQSGIKHPIVKQEDVMEIAGPELDKVFAEMNDNLLEANGTKQLAAQLPQAPQGTVRMTKNGRFYDFPADQAQKRLQEGFANI